MITHKEYMAGTASHQDYFIQFATPEAREVVKRYIGIARIMQSTDTHFNDIPLREWDGLARFIKLTANTKLKAEAEPFHGQTAGQFLWSLSDAVCIAKAIATEIRGY